MPYLCLLPLYHTLPPFYHTLPQLPTLPHPTSAYSTLPQPTPLYFSLPQPTPLYLSLQWQWGVADAEIIVPSDENTELKGSPFKIWSRWVYSHAFYAYCQGFLLCQFLPFRSIHLHFFQNLSRIFPVLAVADSGSCVGPQDKIGHPAGCRFPCWVLAEYK